MATPSDDLTEVLAAGRGEVRGAIWSMSARHPDGDDAAYLAWHVLDHLPEQHRLGIIRHGHRFVSTAHCRAARAAGQAPFDRVDHLVGYLTTETRGPGLDAFYDLGARLREGGRMPMALPGVHLGIWDLIEAQASPAALVGADVVPWRPARGVHLLLERVGDEPAPGGGHDRAAALADLPGVAGWWRFAGTSGHHRMARDAAGLELTVTYLDDDPVEVTARIHQALGVAGDAPPSVLLAAPFEAVVPFAWDQHLPWR